MDLPVAIVGAGLAGLNCARRLQELDIPFVIYEASDAVGGRVRTDLVDGFRLDRGFQVFLPSYPEAKRVLNYDALELKPFARAAMVWYRGRFHRIADPRLELMTALKSVFGPIGTTRDKFRLASLAQKLLRDDDKTVDSATDQPTLDLLRWAGKLSNSMIDRLIRPFFGGVFLERDLATSARFFRFVFRQFAAGPAAIPALGMQAIPDYIASKLPTGSIRLNHCVSRVNPGFVEMETGERINVRAIVVASDGPSAHRLLGDAVPDVAMHGTVTLYYHAANHPPVREPVLMLNGEGKGPVNHIVVMSECSATYAPPDQMLIAANVIGIPNMSDEELDAAVIDQFRDWFRASEPVDNWQLLKVYRIPNALPDMSVGKLDPWQRAVRLHPGLYVCGDHRDQGSINGALESGFRAAQAVAEDLAERRI